MKKLSIPSSYLDLIEKAGNYDQYIKPKTEDLLKQIGFHNLPLHASAPLFYVIDYTTQQYLYVDPSCETMLGYNPSQLIKEGPLFFAGLWHPNDFKIYNEKILKDTLDFLRQPDITDFYNYAFSLNYRFKTKDGNYVTLLQRSSYFLETDSGLPLAAVGFAVDISHFKQDSSIIHTIEKVDKHFNLESKQPLLKKIYYPDDVQTITFSARENEILRFLHKGYSSKQIAKQLGITINTINNHRKKMLYKCNAKNVAELISYSLQKNII